MSRDTAAQARGNPAHAPGELTPDARQTNPGREPGDNRKPNVRPTTVSVVSDATDADQKNAVSCSVIISISTVPLLERPRAAERYYHLTLSPST